MQNTPIEKQAEVVFSKIPENEPTSLEKGKMIRLFEKIKRAYEASSTKQLNKLNGRLQQSKSENKKQVFDGLKQKEKYNQTRRFGPRKNVKETLVKSYPDFIDRLPSEKKDELFELAHRISSAATLLGIQIDFTHFLNFIDLSNSGDENPLQLASELAHTMGKILYLIDHHPEEITSFLKNSLDREAMSKVIKNISAYFEISLIHAKEEMKIQYNHWSLTPMISSNVASYYELSQTISRSIICQDGKLNLFILADVRNSLMKRADVTNPYIESIDNLFDHILSNEQLRKKIENITIHQSLPKNSQGVIRATLGIPINEPIQIHHIQQTIISALMHHLRQGKEGGCFSAFLCIQQLATSPEVCTDQFIELLSKGYLTNIVDGVEIQIPYLFHSSLELIDKQIQIHGGANALSEIAKNPSLIKICNLLQINHPKKTLIKIIQRNQEANGKKKSVSVELILQELIEEHHKKFPRSNRKDVQSVVYLAYNQSHYHPLQRIWINAIANISESKFHTNLKNFTTSSILQSFLQKIHGNGDFLNKEEKSFFTEEISERLKNDLSILYDPELKIKDEVTGEYLYGGFVLYNSKGELLNSGEKLRLFLLKTLKDAKGSLLKKNLLNASYQIHMIRTYHLLKKMLKDSSYEDLLLNEYHKLFSFKFGLETGHPHSKELNLNSPWINYDSGYNSEEILKVYFKDATSKKIFNFHAETPYHILVNLINWMQSLPLAYRQQLETERRHPIPMRIRNYHAFNLTPLHPSWKQATLSNQPSSSWIQSNVIQPGQESSKLPISIDFQHRAVQFGMSLIRSENNKARFREKIQVAEGMSYFQFRNLIISQFEVYFETTEYQKKRFHDLIDEFLLNHLPGTEKKHVFESWVHFADTNWGENSRDLNYCIGLNPGTRKLELFLASSNGSMIRKCNFKTLKKKEWSIFLPNVSD